MPKVVIDGAMLKCSQSLAPAMLTVLPTNMTNGDEKPVATVMDFVPMLNIAAFGMCKSPANPQVAAATAAAMGVLTPQPCIPVTTAPWSPGSSDATVQGLKVLLEGDTCMCAWGGTIEITNPGTTDITDG
jgi:hypothetical protein